MAGMADFYLRWGDALNKGINQIANAPNAYTDAQRNEQGYQNELQQFVDRRTQARRQERQDAFAEIDRQRKIAEEDRLRAEAEKEQARKDSEYQKMLDFQKLILEGKKIANADPRLAQGSPKGPSREEMAWLEDTSGGTLPPQGIQGGDSTALMGQALNQFPGSAADGRVPYTREEIPHLAMSMGQMKPSEYMTATKPERPGKIPLTQEEELEIYRKKREIDAAILAGRPLTPYQQKMLEIYEDRLSGDPEARKLEGRNLANTPKTLVAGLRPLPNAYITPDDVKTVKSAKSVYDSIKDSMDTLAEDFATHGLELWGKHAGEMETTTRNIQLQLKEFYNLGVLNGPDLALMEQQLPNVTELKGLAPEMAFGTYKAKVNRLTKLLEKQFNRKMSAYGFEMADAAPAGQGSAPAPKPAAPPGSAQSTGAWDDAKERRYQELKAKQAAGGLR